MAAAQDNLARKQFFIPATQSETVTLRIAAYCRVSTDSNDQLNSFAAQQNHYNEYIRSHERWEMVDIYADEGITGTSTAKRDDFQRMLSDCRKGRIDKILVKSMSRFARNTTECLESIRELKALGISIFFEEHNIDTKMVSSEMLTAVLAYCAQAESKSISRNMRWSIQKRMENGTFNTCRAATGFRLSGDGLQVHPEEASVVCGIFEDYLRGMNTREIATRLNQEQALGRTWSRRLVDYMLMNERYAGNALLQKKYRTETMPRIKKPNHGERPMYYVRNSNSAIVSQEMFEKASELRNIELQKLTVEYEKQSQNVTVELEQPEWGRIQDALELSKPIPSPDLIRKFVTKIVPDGKTNFQWRLNLDNSHTAVVNMMVEGRKNNAVVTFGEDAPCLPPGSEQIINYETRYDAVTGQNACRCATRIGCY